MKYKIRMSEDGRITVAEWEDGDITRPPYDWGNDDYAVGEDLTEEEIAALDD